MHDDAAVSPSTARRSHTPGLTTNVLAGAVGTLSVLAVPLTLGLLVFAALGSAGAGLGIPAALLTMVVGGVVYGLASGAALPAAGPSSATALILAAFVTRLAADPAGLGIVQITALAGVAVSLCGVIQLLLALAGLGRLVRFVPQPVLAGFMNGVAVLIVLAQLAPLAGAGLIGQRGLASALADWQPAALALGVGTAAICWWLARRWPRAPASLLALLLGVAVHAAFQATWPTLPLGAVVGPLPMVLPWPTTLQPLLAADGVALLAGHATALLSTALVLATIATLESALNTLALDQQHNTRHDPRRELLAMGLTNVVGGAFGALASVVLRVRAQATWQAGGRGRVPAVAGPLVLALLLPLGGHWLGWLPLPVLAGVMLTVALGLVDRGTHRLLAQWWAGPRSRDLHLGLGVMLLVGIATVALGFAAAVGLGVLLSMAVFIERMNRSLLRRRFDAAQRPSRRFYPPAAEAQLATLRQHIAVLELEGALFFGSAERLAVEADALPATCRALVLDLQRVRTIDESGASVLQQVTRRLQSRGVRVLLAGLADSAPAATALRDFGVRAAVQPDADRAIEAAEIALLGDATWLQSSVPLASCALLQGLDADQLAWLLPQLPAVHLAAGAQLFAEGDVADALYIITSGSVSLVTAPRASGSTQRYLSVSPGMTLGETALLDGGGRTASAVADNPATLHALSRATLALATAEQPHIAAQLQHNLALHLSQRLRATARAWAAELR